MEMGIQEKTDVREKADIRNIRELKQECNKLIDRLNKLRQEKAGLQERMNELYRKRRGLKTEAAAVRPEPMDVPKPDEPAAMPAELPEDGAAPANLPEKGTRQLLPEQEAAFLKRQVALQDDAAGRGIVIVYGESGVAAALKNLLKAGVYILLILFLTAAVALLLSWWDGRV